MDRHEPTLAGFVATLLLLCFFGAVSMLPVVVVIVLGLLAWRLFG